MYRYFIKRVLDVLLSFTAIFIFIPVYLSIAVLVRVKLGSPVIFKQERPGRSEDIFAMYKFRSMSDAKDENGILLSDELRLTKFGKWLRATSLDELPELFNILKGDMSIVGPRPLLVKYLPLYSVEQRKRHLVRPGLTGLAQINGRNAIDWKQKFKYDVEYVENISFKNDLIIIFRTISKVIKRDGVSSHTSVTTEEFKGN